MAERDPFTSAETLQQLDEEMLMSAISLNEAGVTNTDEIVTQHDKIRDTAVDDAEYHTAVRQSVFDGPVPVPGMRHSTLLRTNEQLKDVLDPSLPISFPEAPVDVDIPRNIDTIYAIDTAFRASSSATEVQIAAARERVEALERERLSPRNRLPDPTKVSPLAGAELVTANKDLYDAEDALDVLSDGTAGYDDRSLERLRKAQDAYRSNNSSENLAVQADAMARARKVAKLKTEPLEVAIAALHEAPDAHHHMAEREFVQADYAEGTDKAYAKLEKENEIAQTRLAELRLKHYYNPASAELAKAEDKADRAKMALEEATSERNENAESLKIVRSLLEGLPGAVTKEKIERSLGKINDMEDAACDAIVDFSRTNEAERDANQHGMYVSLRKMAEYIEGLDTILADMEPTQLNYGEVATLRTEALRSYLRSVYVAEHTKIKDAVVRTGDGFEGRFQSHYAQRGKDAVIAIQRKEGNVALYPDGSFARYKIDGTLDVRFNSDGTEWKDNPATNRVIEAGYADTVAQAKRVFEDKHAAAAMTVEELGNLETNLYEAWMFNQDNPVVAELAHKANRAVRNANASAIKESTDRDEVLELRAENASMAYDAALIDAVSLNHKHGHKRDQIWPNGAVVFQGKHFNRESRWARYPDGSLRAFDYDEHGTIVIVADYDAVGRRTA